MKDRVAEIIEYLKKWGPEVASEWAESYKDSSPSHFITALITFILLTVVRFVF